MQSLFTSLPSLSFLAVLAPIVLFWGQAKELVLKLMRLLLVETQVQGKASLSVLYYLRQHGKRVPTNVLKYVSGWEYVKAAGGIKMMVFEGTRDLKNQWYWFEGNIVTVSEKRGTDKDSNISYEETVVMRYLRGSIKVESLICRAVQWYEDRNRIDESVRPPRFFVRRFVGMTDELRNHGMMGNAPVEGKMGPASEDWRYSRLINYTIDELGYSKRDFFHVFNQRPAHQGRCDSMAQCKKLVSEQGSPTSPRKPSIRAARFRQE